MTNKTEKQNFKEFLKKAEDPKNNQLSNYYEIIRLNHMTQRPRDIRSNTKIV